MVSYAHMKRLEAAYERARKSLPAYQSYCEARNELNAIARKLPEHKAYQAAYEMRRGLQPNKYREELEEGRALQEIEKVQRYWIEKCDVVRATLEKACGLVELREKVGRLERFVTEQYEHSLAPLERERALKARIRAEAAYDKALVAKFLEEVEEHEDN